MKCCINPLITAINIFLSFSTISAFNHPELKWKSVSTEHFIIHYYDALEPFVYPTWKISEETYQAISKVYGYTLNRKINIVLADYDDYSNGWAEWTSSNVMIWVTDARFDFRSNTTWLRNVITHELAHIISLETKKKMQLLDMSVGIAASSPDETFAFVEPLAKVTLYPSWLSEGIAQLESEKQGNDCWDSRREMLLRSAVLSDRLLTLDEMGHFNHNALGNELVYNQGYSFTKHIERKIGMEKLQRLFRNGKESRLIFHLFFVEFTGYSISELYSEWRDSLMQKYKNISPSVQTEEKVISSKGIFNLIPKISPDGKFIAYFSSGKDDGSRTDLYVKEIATNRIVLKEAQAHTTIAFSPESDMIYFVKSRNPNRNGSYYNDIFYRKLHNRNKKRLTKDARIYNCAATFDGKDLLCVRYNKNVFNVELFSLETSRFSTVLEGALGEPYVDVSLNPSDSGVFVVSKIVNGQSRLFMWENNKLTPIGPGVGQEESPFYAADGRIYYSADYDGVFNIYSVDSKGVDLRRHTNAIGGYFSPVVGADGRIFVSRYGFSGFSVVQVIPFSKNYQIDTLYRCAFQPLPVPKGKVVIKAHPYKGALLRSTWALNLLGEYQTNRSLISKQYRPEIDTAHLLVGAGFQSYKSDALHKKNVVLDMQLGVIRDFAERNDTAKLEVGSYLTKDLIAFPIVNDKGNNKKTNMGVVSNIGYQNWLKPFRLSQSGTTNSDTTNNDPPDIIPFAMPGITFGSDIGSVSFTSSSQIMLAMLFIPVEINSSLHLNRQITRGLQSSVSAHLSWLPIDKTANFAIPIALQWSRNGYFNEDFIYNYGDATHVGGSFTPIFYRLKSDVEIVDTKIELFESINGSITGLNIWHSLALFKYSAFQFSLNAMLYHFNREMSFVFDDKFPDGSQFYYDGMVDGKCIFPIVRNVNKRFGYYWDALYGTVGYSLSMLANRTYLNSGVFSRKVLSNAEFDNNIMVEQTIHAALEFGHIKEYSYMKKILIDFNYEILRRKSSFSVKIGL